MLLFFFVFSENYIEYSLYVPFAPCRRPFRSSWIWRKMRDCCSVVECEAINRPLFSVSALKRGRFCVLLSSVIGRDGEL